MRDFLDVSLITGWMPAVLTILGFLALLSLCLLPPKRQWWIRVGIVLAACALVVIVLDVFVEKIWRPFPDELPLSVLTWAWLALSGLVLGIMHLPGMRWRGWILALVAALVAFVGMSAQINRFYGQWPTLGVALNITTPNLTDLSAVGSRAKHVVAAPPDGYLSDVWKPPAGLPAKGTVSKIHIPGPASGFKARDGYVYLPPAYQANPRPLLPVVVLLAGLPGTPDVWLVSAQVDKMLDRYAKAHGGLAPIVVMADDLGATFANPLCVDSPRGNAETYLAKDVPAWVRANLQTATGGQNWAIAGLSHGGTCALQLAVRAPEVYGRFVDISGEREPKLAEGKQATIDQVFGGDAAAYSAINPIEIMAKKQFPGTAGRIVAGTGDRKYKPGQAAVFAAGEAAGMDMSWLELPGGHNFQVWRPGLEQSLPWLGQQTRLSRS